MMDGEWRGWNWGCLFLIAGFFSFLLAIAYATVVEVTVERRCTKAGWANSKIVFPFEGYCIREENEFEITVPVDSVT